MTVISHARAAPIRRKQVYTWLAVTENDTFEALQLGGIQADILMVATGTPGSSTLILQGSNDGTNWVTILDPAGSAISLTAAGYFAARDAFPYIRPFASGGASQSWNVTISAGGAN